MQSIEQNKINQLSVIICDFLRQLDPAEFDDEEECAGHTRSSAIADALASHLVGNGISMDIL